MNEVFKILDHNESGSIDSNELNDILANIYQEFKTYGNVTK